MKTKWTSLVLAVVAACCIAVWYLSPDFTSTSEPEAPGTPAAVAEIRLAEPVALATPIIEAPATEVVMGIDVRTDRNCAVQRHYIDIGNGTVTDAYSCVPNQPVADDYDHYSDEELRVLSYSDAKAASVLGKRLVAVDLGAASALLLRAAALEPENLDPVMWLAATAHSLRGNSPAANVARANTFVLTRTAQAMGSAASIEWILADLERAGFSAEDIGRLDEQVRKNLRRIREIQLEVFGASVVDEVLL